MVVPKDLPKVFELVKLGKVSLSHFKSVIINTFKLSYLVMVDYVNAEHQHWLILRPKESGHRLAAFEFGHKNNKYYYNNFRLPDLNVLKDQMNKTVLRIMQLDDQINFETAYYISTLFIHKPTISDFSLLLYINHYKLLETTSNIEIINQ